MAIQDSNASQHFYYLPSAAWKPAVRRHNNYGRGKVFIGNIEKLYRFV